MGIYFDNTTISIFHESKYFWSKNRKKKTKRLGISIYRDHPKIASVADEHRFIPNGNTFSGLNDTDFPMNLLFSLAAFSLSVCICLCLFESGTFIQYQQESRWGCFGRKRTITGKRTKKTGQIVYLLR